VTTPTRVAIAGGSLGGLTAGLLLRDCGCDVAIYERSRSKLHSRGAGIVLHDMTVSYLLEHDLLDLDDVSVPARWWCYVDGAGAVIHRDPCRHRFTSWNTLYHALLDPFDPERYHLGREVVGFDQDNDGVRVRFADGGEVECDLLVCADGAASAARAALVPSRPPDTRGTPAGVAPLTSPRSAPRPSASSPTRSRTTSCRTATSSRTRSRGTTASGRSGAG
jgi:2,6-dihydroxypyridine 3-monooxygenase